MTANKPCPFCGGARISVVSGSSSLWVRVECGECGASSGAVRMTWDRDLSGEENRWVAQARAFKRWNERAETSGGVK